MIQWDSNRRSQYSGGTRPHAWPQQRAMFLFTRWDYVCELRPPTGLLLIPQMIYAYGEARWNDTDRGKPKKSERNLSQWHFVHYRSHMDWTGHQPGPPGWETCEYRRYHGTANSERLWPNSSSNTESLNKGESPGKRWNKVKWEVSFSRRLVWRWQPSEIWRRVFL
jgi:hypothetical protein